MSDIEISRFNWKYFEDQIKIWNFYFIMSIENGVSKSTKSHSKFNTLNFRTGGKIVSLERVFLLEVSSIVPEVIQQINLKNFQVRGWVEKSNDDLKRKFSWRHHSLLKVGIFSKWRSQFPNPKKMRTEFQCQIEKKI